jgi:hypothetical protein
MRMNDSRTIWRFFLTALAVWRLTRLLAEERGPWDAIARVRSRLAAHALGRLMDGFYCLSLWVALPATILLSDGWLGLILQWPALSAAAGLFQRATALPPAPIRGRRIEAGEVFGKESQGSAHYV